MQPMISKWRGKTLTSSDRDQRALSRCREHDEEEIKLSAASVTGGYVRGNTLRRPLVVPLTALPLPTCGTSGAHLHGPGERCATAQLAVGLSSHFCLFVALAI